MPPAAPPPVPPAEAVAPPVIEPVPAPVEAVLPDPVVALVTAEPAAPLLSWEPRLREKLATAAPVLLGIADTTGGAMRLATVAQHLAPLPTAPRIVLFNPGRAQDLWPWEGLDSQLPSFPVEWHLGLRSDVFEQGAARVSEALTQVLSQHAPIGVIAVGDGDAVLSATLTAKKRGLPVVRLDAGTRGFGSDEALNATLLEQTADLLFAPAGSDAMQALFRAGIQADKVHATPAPVGVDVLNAVLPLMTTPYGAFLRHRLPIFLGPRWSSEVEGTAYAVVALALDPARPERTAALLDVLVELPALPKLLWLMDGPTRAALEQWRATAARADDVFLVHESMDRVALDRRNSAHVLGVEIRSLPDTLSVLRGASGVLTEAGHVTADMAALLGVRTLWFDAARLTVGRLGEQGLQQRPWCVGALQDALASWAADAEPPTPSGTLLAPAGAGRHIAQRLLAWFDDVPRPLAPLPDDGKPTVPADLAAA
jgi:hypothetical protein